MAKAPYGSGVWIAWIRACFLALCLAFGCGWVVPSAGAATPDALTAARQALTGVAPAVLAPNQPTREGSVQVDPRLVAAGGGLVATGGFAKVTLPPDLSGSIVVPGGGPSTISLSLAPGSAKSAALSDTSAAYASVDGSTAVVVRPSAVGLQVFEVLPAQSGARTFSWTLSLPRDQRLVAIDDQTAAVVAAAPPALADPADSQAGQPAPPAPAGTPSVSPSPAQPVIESEPESAVDAARLVTDADAQLRTGIDELDRSQRLAAQQVVAVVRAPWARGAGGTTVPTSLQVTGPSAISIRVDAPTARGPVVAKQEIITSDALSRAQEAVLAQRYPGVESRLDWRLPKQGTTPSASASGFFTYYWFSGISDSYFAPDSPSAQTLLANNPAGIHLVRAIVAWNAELPPSDPWSTPNARAELARFDSWYQAAVRAGAAVVVAFHGDKDLRTPVGDPAAPPTSSVYNAAVAQFLSNHSQVKYVSAWNEPNYSPPGVYQSPNADQAERYLAAVAYMCGGIGCNALAGDFAGETTDRTIGYIQDYYSSLDNNNPGFQPAQWAFHDYGDVRGYQQGGDRSAPIAHTMDGLIQLWAQWIFDTPVTVWNAESGALYRQKCSEITTPGYTCNSGNSDPLRGESERNWGQHSQRDAAAFVLELANVDPAHILVTLYYNYQAGGCGGTGGCTLDAFGLIGSSADPFSARLPDQAHNGQPNLAYCIIRDRITVDDPRRAALNAC